MFYAIPLESKPTWRDPPWMTLLLIVLNMVVFWGPQRSEQQAQQRAADFYVASGLPALEVPLFVKWLDDSKSARAGLAHQLLAAKRIDTLLQGMEREPAFLSRLRSDSIITTAHPLHAQWKRERQRYEALQPAPFTARWSHSHEKDAELRPTTWVTSAFLHGSTGHLLGNMLFLFLFGFSVELAIGRGAYLAFYLIGATGASMLAGWAYAGSGGLGLGASGAVSALMGMYAVMYRLKRIRFFYQLFFYFNYVTAPALILLPIWIANELMQHIVGDQGIAYMAHLGGLLSGALLMAGALRFLKLSSPPTLAEAPGDQFELHVAAARRLADAMKFEAASGEWRAAAKLRPNDVMTLRSWFNTARLKPSSEDFHKAAHHIFQLKAHDPATLELQHESYLAYLDQARPGVRLKAEDMARLIGRFTRAQQFNDAEKLCHALVKTAPDHPALGNAVCICANGLLQAGHRERAQRWLPHLLRLAPQEMVTRLLRQA